MKRSTGFCTVRAPEKTEYRPLAALPAAGLLSAGAAWLLGVPLWAAGCIVLCAGLLAALTGRIHLPFAAGETPQTG